MSSQNKAQFLDLHRGHGGCLINLYMIKGSCRLTWTFWACQSLVMYSYWSRPAVARERQWTSCTSKPYCPGPANRCLISPEFVKAVTQTPSTASFYSKIFQSLVSLAAYVEKCNEFLSGNLRISANGKNKKGSATILNFQGFFTPAPNWLMLTFL